LPVCIAHKETHKLISLKKKKGADFTEITIAILPMLSDNYAWVLHDGTHAAVVDPGAAEPVLAFLWREKLNLSQVILTHHHSDHCAGVPELKRIYGCAIIGPQDSRMPFVDAPVHDGDRRTVLSEEMDIIATPGHTKTHVIYHFPNLRALFTGDTLFCAGCGRLSECSPADMLQSLIKCACMDDVTSVYCGHEYTEENLLFATSVDTDNKEVWQRLTEVKSLKRSGIPTVPSTLAVERAVNPFLRTGDPGLRKKLKMESATGIEIFAELRRRKDRF
jgi:hydroxyacylglutathione hydrolase